MNEQQRIEIFKAQTQNVRELEAAWKHLKRQINAELRTNNSSIVRTNTKLLALLYCALAEATFSKLIHTPYGLSLPYVEQIKAVVVRNGVKAGWIKCAELASQDVNASKSGHRSNVIRRLERLITVYIFDPSLIRNKLAHGQWHSALNRENDAVNLDLTKKLASLDAITLYRLKVALKSLSTILEDIIESPNKAHMRDYWPHLDELKSKQHEMSKWTMENKILQLNKKSSRAPKQMLQRQ